jgi:hypothetical protein
MPRGRIGSLLIGLGVVVGVAASVGVLLDFEPARLPAALLNIAAYKLTFLAAGGLIAAGAIAIRRARRQADREAVALDAALQRASLSQGQPDAIPGVGREPERVPRDRQRSGDT